MDEEALCVGLEGGSSRLEAADVVVDESDESAGTAVRDGVAAVLLLARLRSQL